MCLFGLLMVLDSIVSSTGWRTGGESGPSKISGSDDGWDSFSACFSICISKADPVGASVDGSRIVHVSLRTSGTYFSVLVVVDGSVVGASVVVVVVVVVGSGVVVVVVVALVVVVFLVVAEDRVRPI